MMRPQLPFAKLKGLSQQVLAVVIAPQVNQESSQIAKSRGYFWMLISAFACRIAADRRLSNSAFAMTTLFTVECCKIIQTCRHVEMLGAKSLLHHCQRLQIEWFGFVEATLFRIQKS